MGDGDRGKKEKLERVLRKEREGALEDYLDNGNNFGDDWREWQKHILYTHSLPISILLKLAFCVFK